MKILVISPTYSLSGVPLAQLRLANSLGNIGHNVDLIYGNKRYSKIKKDKNVKVIFFNKFRVIEMLFPLVIYLLKNKPKIIFSAEDHLNVVVIFACLITFNKARISVSSRVTPFDTYKNSNRIFSKGWFLKKFFPIVNKRANVLTCVSKDLIKQYKKIFPYTRQVGLYNIVLNSESYLNMKSKVSHSWFKKKDYQLAIAAGSLAKWKGFDDLIKAINILIKKKIKIKLVIIGSGPEKIRLNKLINKYELQNRIKIFNPQFNTLKYFKNADIFVLSSKVEGMPNVLIEAMMCGCTVVATNCHTGPREIIGKNKYGYLAKVGNPSDLSKKILSAFNKKISPKKTKNILNKFSVNEVLKKHFSLLKIDRKDWLI